jgi:hypothetical protein
VISIKSVKPAFEQTYVKLMLDVIGRSLSMASKVDQEIQQEVLKFPIGLTISMDVFNHDASFVARVNEQHQLELVSNPTKKPDLVITFKHIHHAFLVLSFQESTAQAFANDRMIADGDLGHAIRLVRCLNKMEAVILPKAVAELAVKQYPSQLSLKDKITGAANIYLKVAQSYFKGSV